MDVVSSFVISRDLLELTRVATGADVVEFVLARPGYVPERVTGTDGGIDQGIELDPVASSQTTLVADTGAEDYDGTCADWVRSYASVPVTGPEAEPGWLVAANEKPDSFDASALVLLGRSARLVEDRLDRALEQVRLDDLGEQLRTNQVDLQATQDRLELSNQELEQFAYIAAHELVAPLRSVAVYAEVLEAGDQNTTEQQRRECVSEIRAGLQRMTQQVQYLLELSSAQRSADPNANEVVSVDEVVQAAVDTLNVQLAEIDAQVFVGPLPVVTATAVPLQSVFANLISNAIRYRDSTRQLKLSITYLETAAGPRVLVADNGSGVEPAHRRRIFRLFERASTTEAGSGIGLALSRRILDAFDATIGVEDNPDGGVVFWIQFPGPETT